MPFFLSGLIPLAIVGGLIFAVVQGLRSMNDEGSAPLEPAEVAKSFALHLGLYIALIGCAVGAIDTLQVLAERSSRLAGTNADLARGLSFLIVGVPSGALLLRASRQRQSNRTPGVPGTSRGWSVYLVAALTTTLIAVLVSVSQIADAATAADSDVAPAEVVQLAVWLVLWLLHWFVLRTRLLIRGDAHLAIGSIVGLTWLLSGVVAVVYRLLDAGYDAAFDAPLVSQRNISFWLVIAVAGAIVWSWHWLGYFNATDARRLPNAVEGDRRDSPLWSFTVVVAGILPGVVITLGAVAVSVAGLGIWFFGTTDDAAVDYFEATPGLLAASLVGLLTAAYHQNELGRSQGRTTDSRNESVRFGDYAVTAAGLVAVVGAVAAAISLFVSTVVASEPFAGSSGSDNTLIIIVTVLTLGGLVWWQRWSHIETQRSLAPAPECDSLWRKLYLVLGFGVGGLTLGVSTIWLLFVLLRDLLDGSMGAATAEDIASPLGWAVAVAAAVWYHLGVWNDDRAVLASRMPPPPAPAPGPELASNSTPPIEHTALPQTSPRLIERPASAADLGELYTLQLADRGRRSGTPEADTEPVETIEAMTARLGAGETTVMVDGTRIVGFVNRPRGPELSPPDRWIIAPDRFGGATPPPTPEVKPTRAP